MTKLVFKVWRRASVRLPDGEFRHRQLVFVTNDGLEVFAAPAATPDWISPVRFEQTIQPSNQQQVGFDIETEAGTVVVTPTGGCACGSTLNRWYPEQYQRVAAWPELEAERS